MCEGVGEAAYPFVMEMRRNGSEAETALVQGKARELREEIKAVKVHYSGMLTTLAQHWESFDSLKQELASLEANSAVLRAAAQIDTTFVSSRPAAAVATSVSDADATTAVARLQQQQSQLAAARAQLHTSQEAVVHMQQQIAALEPLVEQAKAELTAAQQRAAALAQAASAPPPLSAESQQTADINKIISGLSGVRVASSSSTGFALTVEYMGNDDRYGAQLHALEVVEIFWVLFLFVCSQMMLHERCVVCVCVCVWRRRWR